MSSSLKLTNNAVSRLAAGIAAADLSLSVTPGEGALFPAITAPEWFPCTLIRASDGEKEIVKVTARATDVFTIERAQEGTTALAFVANDRVELRLTAGAFDELRTQIATNAADAKTTPVDADLVPLVDSADSNKLKKLTWANIKATLFAALGALIAGGTAKATPDDADMFVIADSAASNATKKVTWANLKALIFGGGTMTGDMTMGAGTKIVFEGTTDDAHESILAGGEPTADRTVTLPDASGTVALAGEAMWLGKAVGEVFFLRDDITGVSTPPTDSKYGYRFIKLTAADAYNTGVLTSESVTGSAPLVVATAVVSLTDSPVNGQTVNLINTERRFLRAGLSGTTQDDDFKAHTHDSSPSGSFLGSTGSGTSLASGGGTAVNYAVEIASTGGTETRPRNIGATAYMRIK